MTKTVDVDTEVRKLNFVSSGLDGSRGFYFILSYKPSAAAKKKGWEGLVEFHTDAERTPVAYRMTCRLRTRSGSVELDESGTSIERLLAQFKHAVTTLRGTA